MGLRKLDEDQIIPLTPPEFHILLALAGRPLYGYAIIEDCHADSEGAVRIGASTMYTALKRLLRARWIEESHRARGAGSSHDRRIYKLTENGWQVLAWETDRLRRAANLAATRLRSAKKP